MAVSPPRLSSRQHDVVQRFRRAARLAEPGVVLLDGEHLLTEALDSGVVLDVVIHDERARAIASRAVSAGATVHAATVDVLDAASPVRTSGGVVALARWQPAALVEALAGAPALVLGLCGVQDPGNLGSAIRAADAFGATGVVAIDDAASPAGWKALRGSMGSAFHLPVARASLTDALAEARRVGLDIVAASAAGGRSPEAVDLRKPTLLLVGNEGAGLPPAALEAADVHLTIPIRLRANSLNVSAAAAVILDAARRQRMASP